jgi:hypothetical protein
MVYAKQENGVYFKNVSGETVPPYGVMEIIDENRDNPDYQNGNNSERFVTYITKPGANSLSARSGNPWLVNRGTPVTHNSYGYGDLGFDKPIRVFCDQAVEGGNGSDNFWPWERHSYFVEPGQWHLRTQSSPYTTDAGGSRLDSTVELFGFVRVRHNFKTDTLTWSGLEQYDYDLDGQTVVDPPTLPTAYFMQQMDPIELSERWSINLMAVKTSDFTEEDEFTDNMPVILRPVRSQAYDATEPYHNRAVGVIVRQDESTDIVDNPPFGITRTGCYRIEGNLELQMYGHVLSAGESIGDVSGAVANARNELINVLYPENVQVELRFGTPLETPTQIVVQSQSFTYVNKSSSAAFLANVYFQHEFAFRYSDFEHEPGVDQNAPTGKVERGLAVILRGLQSVYDADYKIKIGERSWLKLTRLRNKLLIY